ncbi:MAG TPA: PAS domain S-box protein [Rubrobacteraceae bacterium]|nr:PAS domain S-box protein [Rubrobacteraceae bacterium]
MTQPSAIRVLLVEDNPGDARLVEILLSESNSGLFEITHAARLAEAFERLHGTEFDVLMLDLSLPDSSGLETVDRMRATTPRTPIVVLSGRDDEETALQALQSGAEDYLVKGRGDGELMARSVRYAIERKRAEESLRQSEERYRSVVEQAGENIFLVDPETGHILDANAAFHRSLGYTAEELRWMTLYDIVAHDKESIRQNIRRVLTERSVFLGERKYRRKDGSLVDVEVSVSAIAYGGKEALCVVAHDVTERKRTDEELRDTIDRLLALYEAGQIMGSTLESEEIGSGLLEVMQRVSHLTAAVISVRDRDGHGRIWRSVGLESLWQRARYAPQAVNARRMALETEKQQLFLLQRPDSETENLAGLCLPLRTRERTLGVLEAYGPESMGDSGTVEIITSLASQAASALENAQLYAELAEREHRLQELVGKLLGAQEEERRRVAYEVHDGLAQVAVAAHTYLNAFARRYVPDNDRDREKLDRALELIEQTVVEARRVIADLRPTALDDFGLATALRLQVEELRGEYCQAFYEEAIGEDRLPVPIETALFRVGQEALTNIRKHAQSPRVHVKLERQDHTIRLEVRDWGRGFRLGEGTNEGGPGERVGLAGMRERIALLGGDLEVRSRPGSGTSIVAQVPLFGENTTRGR